MKQKTKPRELKPSVRQLLVQRAISQRNMPREFLANELIREIEESGELAPTLETAKRYISRARSAANPLDEPWSIASCSKYSTFFPPESIAILMDCKAWAHNTFLSKEGQYRRLFGLSQSGISIRHAIWIIRLRPLIKEVFKDEIANNQDVRYPLAFLIALIYASVELTFETLDEPFVSTGLDEALWSKDVSSMAKLAGLGINVVHQGL